MRISWLHPHQSWLETASASADGELSAAESARFEAHRAGCARCAEAVEAARAAKRLVSALPEYAAPRSFRLTPEMVRASQPALRRESGGPARPRVSVRLVQAAGGMAATALFAVIALDVLGATDSGGDDGGSSETFLTAAARDSAKDSTALEAAAETATAAAATGAFTSAAGTPPPAVQPSAGAASAETPPPPATGEGAQTYAATPADGDDASRDIPGDDSFNEAEADALAGAHDAPAEGANRFASSEDGSESSLSTIRIVEIALGVAVLVTIGGALLVRRRQERI